MKVLVKEGLILDVKLADTEYDCSSCEVSKTYWVSAPKTSNHQLNWLLENVHSNLIYPFTPATYSGNCFVIM
jgi:hypothetical protein